MEEERRGGKGMRMSEPVERDNGTVFNPRTVLGWWTWSQIWFLVLLFLVPAGLFAALVLFQRDYVEVLWTTPLGIKMGVASLAIAAVAVPVYLVGCVVFNRLLSTDDP